MRLGGRETREQRLGGRETQLVTPSGCSESPGWVQFCETQFCETRELRLGGRETREQRLGGRETHS